MKSLVFISTLGILLAQGQKPEILVPTPVEQLQLDNLRLRRVALDAQYQLAVTQLINDTKEYAGRVKMAHPESTAIFDLASMAWVQHPKAEAESAKQSAPKP